MKLKGKILLLVIATIAVFCAVIYLVCSIRISTVVKEIIQNDLYAMTLAVEESICRGLGYEDEYYVDENGDLWNSGELNLSKDMEGLDSISKSAGIDITVFYGDTRKATTVLDASGQREIDTKASQTVIDRVLKGGETYFAENVDVQGQPYFAYYAPLYNSTDSSNPVGMIFAGMKQEKVERDIAMILQFIAITGISLVVLCSLVCWLVVNHIIRRLYRGISIVGEVAGGNLDIAARDGDLRARDEVGDIIRAIDNLKQRLSDIIGRINMLCADVHQSADSLEDQTELSSSHISKIDRAVNEISQGAAAQADETRETTENVITMGNMIENNNIQIESLHTNAADMTRLGDRAIETLKELEAINAKTKGAIEVIYEQTNTTNDSALKIREAVNLITDIAEETNLLSLNASIEAARAGEQGRGFAVVAGQIQKLAEQSNDSARKIEEIVTSLIEDSDKAVGTMDEVRQIMVVQSDRVEGVSDMFSQLKTGIDGSVLSVNEIAESTGEIDKTRTNVVESAQNLTSIAQKNAASTQETSAAVSELTEIMGGIAKDSKHLEQIADELRAQFQYFRTSGDNR